MDQLNIVGFESRFGFKTAELIRGDLTQLRDGVDVLVVSVYRDEYFPLPGTLLRALRDTYDLDLNLMRQSAAIDLRQALSTWVSPKLSNCPWERVLCVEMHELTGFSGEAFENVFASLTVLGAKQLPASTVAMPLLGAGSQGLDAPSMARLMLSAVRNYLESTSFTQTVKFVELDANRAERISESMNECLGRVSVLLPHDQLIGALRSDVKARLLASDRFFAGDRNLRADWVRLMQQEEIRSVELGILSRKLVERVTSHFGATHGNLVERIRKVEKDGEVPPWACGYMQVLRHFGNSAAHVNGDSHQLVPGDLVAGLHCVQRILDVCASAEPG